MTWLAVAFGGAIGSTLRYGVSWAALNGYLGSVQGGFPLATFLVIILGSFVMGLLWGWQSETPLVWSPAVRGALFTGLLGGFTTFSAFSLEGVQLFRSGEETLGILYLLGSVILGVVASLLGVFLGERYF